MNFMTAWVFGSDYRVIETTPDYTEVKYHIVKLGKSMWLADRGINVLHKYTKPVVTITMLNDGPRTITGIDKGRWLITLEETDKGNLVPPKTFLCKSEKQARYIVEDADYVRVSSQ